jgi:hypothetical protein
MRSAMQHMRAGGGGSLGLHHGSGGARSGLATRDLGTGKQGNENRSYGRITSGVIAGAVQSPAIHMYGLPTTQPSEFRVATNHQQNVSDSFL